VIEKRLKEAPLPQALNTCVSMAASSEAVGGLAALMVKLPTTLTVLIEEGCGVGAGDGA